MTTTLVRASVPPPMAAMLSSQPSSLLASSSGRSSNSVTASAFDRGSSSGVSTSTAYRGGSSAGGRGREGMSSSSSFSRGGGGDGGGGYGGGRGGGGRGGRGRGRGGGGRGTITAPSPATSSRPAPPKRAADSSSSSEKPSSPSPSTSFENDGKVWLAKAIADSGLASRRAALDLVSTGRVTVNGERVSSPATRVVPFPSMLLQASQKAPGSSAAAAASPFPQAGNPNNKRAAPTLKPDVVAVDGTPLPRPAKPVYFVINKPKGYHCTSEAGAAVALGGRRRKLVTDLLAGWLAEWRRRADKRAAAAVAMRGKRGGGGGGGGPYSKSKATAVVEAPPRLFTVGRLDAATTGLILVTNDGAWAHSVAHPSSVRCLFFSLFCFFISLFASPVFFPRGCSKKQENSFSSFSLTLSFSSYPNPSSKTKTMSRA